MQSASGVYVVYVAVQTRVPSTNIVSTSTTPPLTAAIPKAFWATSYIRLALKSWAEMRTVRSNVTKTNRLFDWILFEHVSHAYKGSSSFSALDVNRAVETRAGAARLRTSQVILQRPQADKG